jgi:tryptophan-rich sensory protein
MINNPLVHILTPIILAIIVNGIVFSMKFYKNGPRSPLLPGGGIIGFIWIVIFGLLGYSHYLLYNLKQRPNLGSICIILFIIFSLCYPFLTGGLKMNNVSLLLNLITLIFAFSIGLIVIVESKKAFYYLIPLLLWASYVNYVDAMSTKYL